MSSVTTTPTSTTDSASSSSTGDSSSGSGFSPPSSTLYLLTFLATLFVLLFVSCAIVLRSFLIRRRYRLHLQQQIALGVLPPETLNSYNKDFGERPTLWDVHVNAQDEKGLLEYEGWEDVLPISARISHDPATSSTPGKSSPTPAPSLASSPPPRYHRFTQALFARNRRPAELSTPSTLEDPEPPTITTGQDVQIAVMVAMPSQSHRHDSIPEIVIGMSTVPVKGES
ncbi:hypothetical protein BC835DRAFT_594723 [Cytidiella melzeri]|nr:hypothetical protein BC835DRAFT_594723 [Cytidiella melzeri]